ncbi:transcription initiation factor IIF subunit beta-like isoform X5 [Macadamia integrifolia]|uniref:transcription initiation factor IIF subunit beta-like isoform X5 n=1 Tax=Macadamia integrifolia TaxID=60698 RepID=UPI001C4E9C0F|nr:transcription initiation factor IIF subunit beta-like isoform X5 [Macadamia integrifolia]
MRKNYSLNMFKDFVPMSVFSETNRGRVAVEGNVEHKFDMKPHDDIIEEYGKLCRERTNKSMIKTRQIQVIDNDRGVLMRPMPGMVGLPNSKDKKKVTPVKGPEMKRTRRDRGELEDIMFMLFERQPNWALKQLVQETDQPVQFLKEILNELCVYIRGEQIKERMSSSRNIKNPPRMLMLNKVFLWVNSLIVQASMTYCF